MLQITAKFKKIEFCKENCTVKLCKLIYIFAQTSSFRNKNLSQTNFERFSRIESWQILKTIYLRRHLLFCIPAGRRRETDTFYHGKRTWNNTIVKSNFAFGHINIFTYSSYSILLYSQIKEPKKREIMQIFLKNFYVPARKKILKILLKICFFKNICFIVEDCRSNACSYFFHFCVWLAFGFVFFRDFAPLTNVEINNFFN